MQSRLDRPGNVDEDDALVALQQDEPLQDFGAFVAQRIVVPVTLAVSLDEILSRLEFGVKADRFEHAFDELGRTPGFSTQRPDKEWKEGPDNLWALRDSEYLLVECKSEVHLDRKEIYKEETGQMNNAGAWFTKNYKGVKAKNVMILPAGKLANGAGFNEEVQIMRKTELNRLTKNVRSFFAEFASFDFKDLSATKVRTFLNTHHFPQNATASCRGALTRLAGC